MSHQPITNAPRITIIDGSAGSSLVLCTLIQHHWPDAIIEALDPFSQTVVSAGMMFGGKSDLIILGGIGTLSEALITLKKLTERGDTPPIILLVSQSLSNHYDEMIAAGATNILFKDALSGSQLINVIKAIQSGSTLNTALINEFGRFSFEHEGLMTMVYIEGMKYLQHLSHNEFAVVFLAERIANRERVVVKVLIANPQNKLESITLTTQRYRLFAAIHSNHVAHYIDVGMAGSWPYSIIEYFPEGDLRQRMRIGEGMLPLQALQTLQQMILALIPIHAGKFAHLDLKPENIFFRADGSLVLIDFNISMPFGTNILSSASSVALGSPYYMSPEVSQGLIIDGRSDLYSAGVVFFEMLTGTKPFAGESDAQIIYRHLHDEIPLLPKNIRALQPIVDGLMAKKPGERFASCEALLTALAPFLTQ